MSIQDPSQLRFEAHIRHPDAEQGRRLTRDVAEGLDLLPPGISATADTGVVAHAFVDLDECAELVRRGFRVELTAIAEGPADPDRAMTDDQSRQDLARRLGADRMDRAERGEGE